MTGAALNQGRARGLAPVAVLGAAAAFPLLADPYQVDVGAGVLLFVILGLGINVVVGLAGLLDLGYAAFFAIGAYTTAILTAETGLSWWATLLPAMAVTAVAGAILGYPTLRLRGDYLAIVTLGFGEIVRIAAVNLDALTGGPNGKVVESRPTLAGHELTGVDGFYWLALTATVVTWLATRNLARSRLGRAWRSVRDDETAAAAIGINCVRAKLLAYVLGSIWAGLAGTLSAGKFGIVNPTSFTFTVSVLILVVVVLGGRGSLPGVVLGAIVVVALPEALRGVEQWKYILFGIALIAFIRIRPQGLWPARLMDSQVSAEPDGTVALDQIPAAGAAPGEVGVPVLEVIELSHHFGGLHAIVDLSFQTAATEIVGLIGPNGAGKTTVFNAISGAIRPAAGRVVVGGRDVSGRAPHRVVAAGLGRTFQGTRVFESVTALENVLPAIDVRLRTGVVGSVLRLPHHRRAEQLARAEARAWLEFTGLSGRAGCRAGDLPLAEQRRLEIARALAGRPRVLLLDEPAAGLNPTEKAALAALIRRVRRAGTAVLLVEHDMDFVQGLCDRVLVMDAGRLLTAGTAEEIRGDPRVVAAYLGVADDPLAERDLPRCGRGDPLLRVAGLAAGYGHVTAVHGVSLEVCDREIVALFGANGAGKTTTLRAITGLTRARAGSVHFAGRDLTNVPTARVVSLGLAHVPERQRVFTGLSVEENLRLGAFTRRGEKDVVARRREEVYQLFPRLRERRTQAAGTLSGGERQMLAIGRALMVEPRLLCLDEPSTGLAPVTVRRTFAAIAKIARGGTAVLIVEQNTSAALRIADYAYVLETGQMVLEGSPEHVGDNPAVRAAYLGAELSPNPVAGRDAEL